jgi:hypothetical protein
MAAGAENILNDLIVRVGRVRRWLLALSGLRIAAAGLACVSLYIGLYAWLDHRFHFGHLGRASALALFVLMLTAGLYCVVRVLRRDMTYAHAANYIEARRSFDQQLVAAVEFYEGRADYPYSRALAEQLVVQVDRAAREYPFDSTIRKWQGYLLAGFVLLCVGVVGLFVRENVLYLSSYLARLVRPFAAIQPVPATVLESVSGDLVAGVDAPVTLAVEVQGRTPESVTLVLTRHDPNDTRGPSEPRRIEMTPVLGPDGRTQFTATKSFDSPGEYEYRFETSDARSDAHTIRVCETPAIKSVTAKVFPPRVAEPSELQDAGGTPATRDMPATEAVQPYEVELTDRPLEVLPNSRIEFTAQATTALREAMVVGPDGRPSTQMLDGADSFGFELTADAPSAVKLSGTSTEGLSSSEAKELRIALKTDEPAQFKLVSPEGDYLTTDVASIPITFEVTDDFGLRSARLICEIPGRDPVVLESAQAQGTKQVSLTHVLELEDYDLHVGDTILFYATAEDIDTGPSQGDPSACSEIYFIEIRPYRQFWHPQAGGQSASPGPIAEDLITVLEYTRAAVRKTWTLARSPGDADADRTKGQALSDDLRYCATLLAKIRDDPEAGFGAGDKAVMNEVLRLYEQARHALDAQDADAALPPVQEAYRILRMFIDELHMKWSPPQSGSSPPQETPERVKLQEQPQDTRLDERRAESLLKEMQQKIDSLARQQQSLKADLAKAVQQEKGTKSANEASSGQETGDGSQGQSGGEQAAGGQEGQSGIDGSPGQTQSGAQASPGAKGSSEAAGPGEQGGQTGRGQSGQDGQPGGQSGGAAGQEGGQSSARTDAQMRMLAARQKALREQASQLSRELAGLPAHEHSSQGRAGQQAKGHVDQAAEAMEQFEQRLADARYESLDSSKADHMADLADSASRRLADAGQAIRRGLSGASDKAQEMADQLARDAEAYDESLSEAEKQQMRDRLAAAQRLLESMAGTQWATISGGGPGTRHVYTKDSHTTPADTARLLARQFWSVALEAKKRPSQSVEEEPSDVGFFEAEKEFFESAARYRQERVER